MMPTICVWEGCGWLWVVFGRGVDGCGGGGGVLMVVGCVWEGY